MRHLHLRETQFFWLFGPVTGGMMLGAALSGQLAGRVTPRRTVMLGYVAMIAAALANIAFHASSGPELPWSVAPLFLYAVGMAFSMPSIVLFGLDLFPAQQGLAASCQAFVMTGMNAVTAGLLSPLANGSALQLAIVSSTLTAAGAVCMLLFFKSRASDAEVAKSAVAPTHSPTAARSSAR